MDDPTYIDEYTRAVALDPRTSALLVVDMQNASGSRAHGLGRLLARGGARVIHVTYGARAPDFSDAPMHLRKWLEATNNRVGTPDHEVIAELEGRRRGSPA